MGIHHISLKHIPFSGFLNRVSMKLVNFKSIKEVTYIIITVDRQRLTTYLSLNVTQVTESNWKVDFVHSKVTCRKHVRKLILGDNHYWGWSLLKSVF